MKNNYDSFQTAPEIAYNIIIKKILDGEYQPGTRLSRRKMAEVTNVSVIPVIEALKKLEEDGLVESQPKWGSFVTIPTVEKVIASYQAREAIECQVARILSEKITPEQKTVLYKQAEELDTIPYDTASADASHDRHMDFHKTLVEYSGNEMLSRMLSHVNLFWILCNAMAEIASNKEYPRYWHRKLMDDICSGDPDRAETSMREHVLDSAASVIEKVRNRAK